MLTFRARCPRLQVLAGFTSAAAILISSSQLKHLLGMPIPRAPLPQMLVHIATHLTEINPVAFLLGAGGLACLPTIA